MDIKVAKKNRDAKPISLASRSLVSRVQLIQGVDNKTRAQFRLKPSGLGRHDVARVGDVDDLLHAHRIEREGDFHLTAVDATFQLAEAADTANEVDALVGAEVFDAKHLVEDEVGEDGDIEHADGVVVV